LETAAAFNRSNKARDDAAQRLDLAKPVAVGEIPSVRRSNRATR
jgi:hypothetical protein